MPSEQKWYALTGRVVDAKIEADGDIHIALQDASGCDVADDLPIFHLTSSVARFEKCRLIEL